jgi:small-conductance mechanosensitive channel
MTLMLESAYAFFEEIPYFFELILTAIVWTVALIFVRFNKRLFTRVNDELSQVDVEDRSIKALDQMLDLFTMVVAIFITLYIWGVDEMIYAALTTIGVVGMMLAFAVKDIASNFISGIMLILSKDILIGDDIEVEGIEGVVEKITIRTTSIRQYNGALVLVPNSIILNNPVIDYSATEKRRVEVTVVLSSAVDMESATEALKLVAENEPRRLEGESIAVLIKGFEASSVKLELRFWVASSDLTNVKSDVHGAIQRTLHERHITLEVPVKVLTP